MSVPVVLTAPLAPHRAHDGPHHRGVCVDEAVAAGRVVAAFTPAAAVLHLPHETGPGDDHRLVCCNRCFQRVARAAPCRGCRFAVWCLAACARADAPYHRVECRHLASRPGALECCVLRMALHAARLERFRRALDTLTAHQEAIAAANGAAHHEACAVAASLTAAYGAGAVCYARLVCLVLVNAAVMTNTFGEASGVVFDPVLALLNHRCVPNTAVVFEGPTVRLVAMDPLAAQTELTINYCARAASTPSRQQELGERFFFRCTCDACCGADVVDPDGCAATAGTSRLAAVVETAMRHAHPCVPHAMLYTQPPPPVPANTAGLVVRLLRKRYAAGRAGFEHPVPLAVEMATVSMPAHSLEHTALVILAAFWVRQPMDTLALRPHAGHDLREVAMAMWRASRALPQPELVRAAAAYAWLLAQALRRVYSASAASVVDMEALQAAAEKQCGTADWQLTAREAGAAALRMVLHTTGWTRPDGPVDMAPPAEVAWLAGCAAPAPYPWDGHSASSSMH